MKIAIMQPYLFPYLGYFQLIHSVNTFVFFDDVNFIKRGWINRNKLLNGDDSKIFTVPLEKMSQNKLIKDTQVAIDKKWLNKFYKSLAHNYSKAPYFNEVLKLLERVFYNDSLTISELAINSVKECCMYLNLNRNFELSSINYHNTKEFKNSERLLQICKLKNATTYINPIGGLNLYQKSFFEKHKIELYFLKTELKPYNQFDNEFVEGLSIIDVLMFNSKEEILNLLKAYSLV